MILLSTGGQGDFHSTIMRWSSSISRTRDQEMREFRRQPFIGIMSGGRRTVGKGTVSFYVRPGSGVSLPRRGLVSMTYVYVPCRCKLYDA